MEWVKQETIHYVKCDFCGTEASYRDVIERSTCTMLHFSISFHKIDVAATLDICSHCVQTVIFENVYDAAVEAHRKMQIKQPHNADVEEWRR